MKKTLLLALAVTLLALRAGAETPLAEAKAVFGKYVALEANFDPAVADLYSDDAVIRNTRRFPDGTSRELSMSAPSYKKLIRAAMPLAKLRGDTSKYSDVAYKEEEPGRVRITSSRYSDLKKYSSPLSIAVARKDGKWLIVEELSESRP